MDVQTLFGLLLGKEMTDISSSLVGVVQVSSVLAQCVCGFPAPIQSHELV